MEPIPFLLAYLCFAWAMGRTLDAILTRLLEKNEDEKPLAIHGAETQYPQFGTKTKELAHRR